jgi:AraC-like DNA-binding protein
MNLLCDSLREQGVNIASLLHMAGIDAEKFERRDASLEPAEMESFVGTARRLTGRDDLGFELGRAVKMTSHHLLGYGMLSCRNFDEVLRLTARHYHLMIETFSLWYRRIPAGAGEAIYTPTLTMSRELLHFYLEALAVAHDNQLRQMLPSTMGAVWDIHISMPPPAHLARYVALAPTRYHFDEGALPGVRVVMSAAVLDHPLPLVDARMVEEIDMRCRDMSPRLRNMSQSWVEYLRMMLRHVEGEAPTLERIAQMNQVSPRTIERHLQRENVSFRELLLQARIERACELLRTSPMPVAQIAQRLGFSDAANFSRAFQRAIGATPTAYRQSAREETPVLQEYRSDSDDFVGSELR